MTLDQKRSIGTSETNHNTKVANICESQCSIMERLKEFASSVPDFRRLYKGNIRHKLSDMIMLMILGRISGHVGRNDIIEFGKYNLKQFQKMDMLKNGVPSEPTLCRVENGIDAEAMAGKMQHFAETFRDELLKFCHEKEIICIDGKAERGTIQQNGRNPDIVSAYSFNTRIIIATEACKEKSNEIKAVPLLLDKIDIAGKIVTADAMSMQKDIIDKIIKGDGDFVIELKANQRSLRYNVEDRLADVSPVYSYTVGPELEHGRIETRTYRIYNAKDVLVNQDKWGVNLAIIEFEADTRIKSTGEHYVEKRYYLTSLSPQTPLLGIFTRRHWSIESMHWALDVNLRQDNIRRKSTKAARNLDTIQRIVYSTFSIWKGLRKKRSDKAKGIAKLMRHVSKSFTNLKHFLEQK